MGRKTSNPKGKGIDPREWGNIHINNSEADVEAQQAALQSYKLAAMEKQSKHPRESRYQRGNSKSHGKHWKNNFPVESCPIAQVPSKSYIGVALKNTGRRVHPGDSSDGPSSDSSSSDSSSDLSDESDPSSSSDDESDTSQDLSIARSRARSHHHASKLLRSHGHSKKKKHDKIKSQHSGHSKAIKPNEYDSAVDAHAYHQFIKESSAYIEDSGMVHKT